MAENKKYYYLKLKENFYDSEEMIILQNMPDGYIYSDILLKLYLRSLKNEGKLIFKDIIPYTPSALAQVVRHQVGTVEKALKIFQELGLIEVLDNGAIFMTDIQNFIGKSTTEADRIRSYRSKIQQEKISCTNVRQMYDKNTPEIEIEKDIDIDIDIEKDINIEKKAQNHQLNDKISQIIDIFNTNCTNLPKVIKITDKRKTAINKLLKEITIEQFKEICKKSNNSNFLTGNNKNGWKANFDFLIRVDKAIAILEGQYQNNKEKKENYIKQNNYNNYEQREYQNKDLDNFYSNLKERR